MQRLQTNSTHETRMVRIKRELQLVSGLMLKENLTYKEVQSLIMRSFLAGAISRSRNRPGRAAKILGVHRNTIGRMMDLHGFPRPIKKPVASQGVEDACKNKIS